MLHRLPNGIYITLADITLLKPYPANKAEPAGFSHLQIELRSDKAVSLSFATFAEAVAFADTLAPLVNAARAEAVTRPGAKATSLPDPFTHVCYQCHWQGEPAEIPGNLSNHPCCPQCHKTLGRWTPLIRVPLAEMSPK